MWLGGVCCNTHVCGWVECGRVRRYKRAAEKRGQYAHVRHVNYTMCLAYDLSVFSYYGPERWMGEEDRL